MIQVVKKVHKFHFCKTINLNMKTFNSSNNIHKIKILYSMDKLNKINIVKVKIRC